MKKKKSLNQIRKELRDELTREYDIMLTEQVEQYAKEHIRKTNYKFAELLSENKMLKTTIKYYLNENRYENT